MLTHSLCFLLCNHRNLGKPMNMVNIQGSSLCWGTIQLKRWGSLALIGECPDGGFLLGVRAGCSEKRLISQERTMSFLWNLEATTSFRCCGCVWIRFGGSRVSPSGMILELCVCMCFLRRRFPLTQHKSTVNFLNTSHHHCTLTIHYLILSSIQSFLKAKVKVTQIVSNSLRFYALWPMEFSRPEYWSG